MHEKGKQQPYCVDDIEILTADDPVFRFETRPLHTPYTNELAFYDAVAQGDVPSVERQLDTLLRSHGLVIGRMSDSMLRQTQYWAVSCITLAARAVIGAGMPENEALLFSDALIRTLDGMQNPDEILNYLAKQALALTQKMAARKSRPPYPAPLAAALRQLHATLPTNPTVRELAAAVHLSPDHLSRLFRKQFGMPLKQFVQEQRLRYARNLLIEGTPPKDVAYLLHFASESHFIRCFRTRFGKTPRQFLTAYRAKTV